MSVRHSIQVYKHARWHVGVVRVSTWAPLEAEMLWQLGVYIRNASTPPAGISPWCISSLSPLPSSLEAPATQAAQGFMSYTHGWQRGQPLSLGALITLLWRHYRVSCPKPLSLCTEPCRGPAITSFSETPGEMKESVSCVPVAESKSEEQPGAEPQKETEACPKIHSRRFRE